MNQPAVLLAILIGLGLLYVLLPVALHTLFRYRPRKSVRCPETGTEAQVRVDAPHAALTSTIGRLDLRVRNCSLWAERMGCARTCVRLLEGA